MFYVDCVLKSFWKFIFTFMHQLFVSVAVKVLVALHLCIQSRSEGFGGSVSAHTNRAVDFWWIYLFVV